MVTNIPVCIQHKGEKHFGDIPYTELFMEYPDNIFSNRGTASDRAKKGLAKLTEENVDEFAQYVISKLKTESVVKDKPIVLVDFDDLKFYDHMFTSRKFTDFGNQKGIMVYHPVNRATMDNLLSEV